MRLSLASRDVPNSPEQPTERRLDEEALSRMDGERGFTEAAVDQPAATRKAAPGG